MPFTNTTQQNTKFTKSSYWHTPNKKVWYLQTKFSITSVDAVELYLYLKIYTCLNCGDGYNATSDNTYLKQNICKIVSFENNFELVCFSFLSVWYFINKHIWVVIFFWWWYKWNIFAININFYQKNLLTFKIFC